MDEAEQQTERRRRVTKSSVVSNRKPLANITNLASSFSQSNKPGASDSSQNPIHLYRPIGSDNSVGDENRIEHARRQATQNTRSKSKAAVSVYQTSIQETRNNVKERNVPAGSSTLEKVKDQGKANQSCLGKTKNDGNKISVAPCYPSMVTIKNTRKAIDVPSSAHHMKNANSNTNTHITRSAVKIMKDKGKENDGHSSSGNANINLGILSDSVMTRKDNAKAIAQQLDHPSFKNIIKSNRGIVPDSVMTRMGKGKSIADLLDYTSLKHLKSNTGEVRAPLKGVVIKERGESAEKISDKGKESAVRSSYPVMGHANGDMGVTISDSLKRKDKGKAIAEPLDYPSKKNVYRNMAYFPVPLKGVIIKERGETVLGSSRVDIAQKDKGKAAVTPINNRTLEKKDKLRSCPPPLRTTDNRNAADGSEAIMQSTPQTEPPPNKKKKRCTPNEEYTLPQDYVEQQRAYFKEIDDFELQVEEV